MKHQKRSHRVNSGFGILELLLVATLSSGIILGTLTYFTNFSSSISNQSSRGQWASLVASLDRIFADQKNCKNLFRKHKVVEGGVQFDLTIPVGGAVSHPQSIALDGARVVAKDQELGKYVISDMAIIRSSGPNPVDNGKWSWDVAFSIQAKPKVTNRGLFQKEQRFFLKVITPAAGPGVTTVPIESCTNNDDGIRTDTSTTTKTVCAEIVGGIWENGRCRIQTIVETTTGNDPTNPVDGQMWLRTDL